MSHLEYRFPGRGRKQFLFNFSRVSPLYLEYRFPGRGRKLLIPEPSCDTYYLEYRFPGRGRKRICGNHLINSVCDLEYRFPGRGRKRSFNPAFLDNLDHLEYRFPGRGRKLKNEIYKNLLRLIWNIDSLVGDGN